MESILKTEADLRKVFKEALIEALEEKKDLFNDLFREISEDIALARAIEEGEKTPEVSRSAVFDLLEHKS
jgi:predicted ATP-dependent endonuclease of OLD family